MMSGHGTQPAPKTSQGGAGPTGGARPRRPPESAHKPAGTGASSIPSDGKSLISSPRRLDGLRAVDVMGVLQEQLAILSGGRDRRGGALLTFPATPRRERAKPEDYRTLLQYLLGVPW